MGFLLLAIDGGWGRVWHSSLRMKPLVGSLCSSRWANTHLHMGSTIVFNRIFFKKRM